MAKAKKKAKGKAVVSKRTKSRTKSAKKRAKPAKKSGVKEVVLNLKTKPNLWLAITAVLIGLIAFNLIMPYVLNNSNNQQPQDNTKPVGLIYLVDENCDKCYDVTYNGLILENIGLDINESLVSINSVQGISLLNRYNITKVPTFILSPEALNNAYLAYIWLQVGSIEQDGNLIFRSPEGFVQADFEKKGNFYDLSNITDYITYKDLTTGETEIPKSIASCEVNDSIKLILFLVAECPYCQKFELETLTNLTKDFGSKLVIEPHYLFGEFSNGTLTSMHGQAEYEENLRQICANQQGKWLNYTLCVDNNGTWSSCVSQAGLNLTKFNECYDNEAISIARDDLELAVEYNIQGTPTIIFNCNLLYVGQWTNYTIIKDDVCSLLTVKPSACS